MIRFPSYALTILCFLLPQSLLFIDALLSKNLLCHLKYPAEVYHEMNDNHNYEDNTTVIVNRYPKTLICSEKAPKQSGSRKTRKKRPKNKPSNRANNEDDQHKNIN